tara:strand:+ start:406 stop:585 length:180 start_codon:yes stop_codon:yes gene_type:complete
MVKIKVFENKTNHKGELFQGFVNVNGKDLVFSNTEDALNWMIANAEFIAEFNFIKLVHI